MSYQPKSYNKFLAGAATAAVVASAVVPVATHAAEKNLTDVKEGSYYAEAVNALAEAGVIKGYEDGTFRPNNQVTRAEVAKIIAVQLGLDTENAGSANYSDAKGHWANTGGYLAAVAKAGIMKGDGNGTFRPNAPLTRAEMASIVVRAYDLQAKEGFESQFKDLNAGGAWAADAIKTLEANGYANGIAKGQFGSASNVKRADVAVFLFRVAKGEAAPTVESVSAINNIEVNEGAETVNLPKEVEVTLSNGEKAQKAVEWDKKGLDLNKPGEYTLTGDVADTDLTASVKVVVKAVDPKVESVSAINTTSAKVTFNKAVDSIDKSDFAVANKATSEKQVVKSVELSEDKKSATLVFYSEVSANTTYVVDAKIGEKDSSAELVIGSLAPTSIEIPNQTVVAGEATEIKYTVKDADGVDITNLYPASSPSVSFETPATGAIASGKITLAKGTSTTVNVVIKDANNKVLVESAKATFTAEAAEAASISNWTVADNNNVDFTVADFKQNNIVTKGAAAFLNVQLKDQFNTVTTGTVEYDSLNTDVAVVDKSTGKITAFATGIVPVKVLVKSGDTVLFTKTVELKVQDAAKVSTVSLDQSSLTVSSADDAKTVKATVKDQYGTFVDSNTVTATISKADGSAVAAEIDNATTNEKGEATLTLPTLAAGSYKVVVKAADNVTATLSLTVKDPGTFAKYEVRGLESTLDKNVSDSTVSSMTPEVVSVDANGLKIEKENANVVVLDKDGKAFAEGSELATVKDNKVELTNLAKAGDEFTVKVSLDNKVLTSQSVKVVDTTKAKVVDFTKYTLEATVGHTLAEDAQAVIQIDGKDISKVPDLVFVTADSSIVAETTGEIKAAGTTTVFITSVDDTKLSSPVKLTIKAVNPVGKPTE
ncbi:hypothetical protein FOA22_08330 [Heyndrickxia oleronia]|uniref:S-layer homology domain-containing protein n=1 Tax=Heyndrickxia oleronia TaxID=38875 RepID=UPI00333A0E73